MIPIPMPQQQQVQLQPPTPQQQVGGQQGLGQQQQQHAQQLGQNHQQQGQSGQPFVPPPPPSGQDWTLSSVLHYLQSEWRRYERDRNEWEIERAESRARIALLEGERRSFENVKSDFMRRIKMLEYALRVERTKNLEQAKGKTYGSGSSSKGHKSSSSKDDAGAGELHKNGSDGSSPKSEGGLELHEPAPMPNGVLPHQNGMAGSIAKSQSPAPPQLPTSNTQPGQLGLGRPPIGRDPKSRARSREYLKQCLQEITYLTSPQAVNPLPNRPLVGPIGGSASAPNLPVSIPNLPSFSVNDYSQQSQQPVQQSQPQQLPQPQYQQQQAQPQQQVQLLPQPQIQPAPQLSSTLQPATTGTVPPGASNTLNMTALGRPRKVVPDVVNVFPQPPGSQTHTQDHKSTSPLSGEVNEVTSASQRTLSPGPRFSSTEEAPEEDRQTMPHAERDDGADSVAGTLKEKPPSPSPPPEDEEQHPSFDPSLSPSSSSSGFSKPGTPGTMDSISLSDDHDDSVAQEPTQLTAIFRPDGAWREKLRAAHEEEVQRQQRQQQEQQDPERLLSGGIQPFLSSNELLDDDSDMDGSSGSLDTSSSDDSTSGPVWKAKRTLRSHLDGVRAISFHPNELSLATGSDDNTIKIWRIDQASLASSSSRPATEIEPQVTLRAHTAPITALAHSASRRLLYSASLDATIRVWQLPSANRTTYAPFETSTGVPIATLVGHTDAVWDCVLVRNESALVSCGSEGTVKIWDVGPAALLRPSSASGLPTSEGNAGKLLLSWSYNGTDGPAAREINGKPEAHGATSLAAIRTDLRKVAVAYRNAVVKIFDLETGKETARLPSDVSYDGTERSQINKIVSHQTVPLLVTAHEDRFIRIFDLMTSQCTHSMLAHLDGVTSLSIDPSGFTLISGGQDCSVRFWDLLKTHTCIQEATGHRKKGGEGVLDVAFHPGGLPFLASAGADGVVRLYAST